MRKECIDYMGSAIDSIVRAELYYRDRPYESRHYPDKMVLSLLKDARRTMKDIKEFMESEAK